MIIHQVPGTNQVAEEQRTAVHGALWVTIGMVSVGLSNYGYSLLLTHLLDVAEYSVFSAGQGLIFWATNIATVSVPWTLAQSVVRAKSDHERNSAIRFAKLMSSGTGLIAGMVVGGIAVRISGPETAAVVALSTFIIFLGTTTSGWLQGNARMTSLSLLFIAENALKNVSGILLVTLAGLKGAGALAGFGIGGLAILVRWPRTLKDRRRSWHELVSKELLNHAIATAGAQGIVSLFVAVDVVLVAMLPGNRALAASYQASTTLTRIPLYIAAAVATAYFPTLTRQASNGVIAAQAIRLYTTTGLPLMAILATIPEFLVTKAFPASYGSVDLMLKYTAVTGFAAGGISLITTFFQAANEYSCLKWLAAGLSAYVVALTTGWRIDGVVGLAAGGTLGSTAALMIMGYRLVLSRGLVVLASIRLLESGIAGAALVLTRSYWLLWLAVAFVFGLRAAIHFLRPSGRHEKLPWWATTRSVGIDQAVSVTSLLIDAIWREDAPERTERQLNEMLALGQLNGVEGKLAQLYPAQLPDVLAKVRQGTHLYSGVFREAARRLREAGIPAVYIEEGLSGFRIRENIDLVIPRHYWKQISRVLPERDCVYIEWTDMILLHPPVGPRIHIYPDLSSFGFEFLATNRLVTRALRTRDGFLVPSRVDYLCILLGRALFHHYDLDLSQLVGLWGLIRSPTVIMAARVEASEQGWLHGFDEMLALVGDSINRIEQGQEIELPVRLSMLEPRRSRLSESMEITH